MKLKWKDYNYRLCKILRRPCSRRFRKRMSLMIKFHLQSLKQSNMAQDFIPKTLNECSILRFKNSNDRFKFSKMIMFSKPKQKIFKVISLGLEQSIKVLNNNSNKKNNTAKELLMYLNRRSFSFLHLNKSKIPIRRRINRN